MHFCVLVGLLILKEPACTRRWEGCVGAEAWRETGCGLSPREGLRTLEVISNDLLSLGPSIFVCKLERTSPICVLVQTYNPRAWKEDSKASLGYRVKKSHLNQRSK